MKKAFVLVLAILLLLTGCGNQNKQKDVAVTDALCPYELRHKDDALHVTLEDSGESGLVWQVKTMPQGICQVAAQDGKKEHISRYQVTGIEEGSAQLVFTGAEETGAVVFTLTVTVDVDGEGRVAAAESRHEQHDPTVVQGESFRYEWDVDADGLLTFRFINEEDMWSVTGDGGEVCTIQESVSTPSGCKFTARANSQGQVSIVLVGEHTQRSVAVNLQVTEAGALEVVSVQEQ